MNEDNELWNYAVKVYSDPEIMELCLLLQNAYKQSINQLLFALWLAETGRRLPSDLDMSDLLAWRATLLDPLRALRYQLREMKGSDEEENCYQQIKAAELSAEKVEIGLLFKLQERCPQAIELTGLGYRNLCVAAGGKTSEKNELQVLLAQLSDKAAMNSSI